MTNTTRAARVFVPGMFLFIAVLLQSGCASPKAVVESAEPIDIYRKVYIAVPVEDPRDVYPRVLDRLKRCGFEVAEIREDGPVVDSQGSGFLVTTQGHLLTCAHVVQGHQLATVWIAGTRHPAKVLVTDTNLDVALLQLKGDRAFECLRFAGDLESNMGEEVFSMGFPLVEVLGESPRLNKGLVSATVGLADNPRQLQISAEVQPGNSGGPLLNARCEVVGLVIATLNPLNVFMRSGGSLPQNVNFAVKGSQIVEFLQAAAIQLPAAGESPPTNGFDGALESLGIVRAGDVRDEDLKAPSLLCLVKYFSFWDMFYRFQIFHVEFRDTRTGKVVLKAGQYGDNVFSSEDRVLEQTFREIFARFRPGHPNPFGEPSKATTGKPK